MFTLATTPVSSPADPETPIWVSRTRYPSFTSSPTSAVHETDAAPSSVALNAWKMKPPIDMMSMSYVSAGHPSPESSSVETSNGGSSSWARVPARRSAMSAARILSVVSGVS